jgi:hypothetical protein
VLPDSLTKLDNGTFCCCFDLKTVTLPAALLHIGDDTFSCCRGLTAMAPPPSLIYIGANAFEYCTELTELALPASLKHIGDDAFEGCTKLTLHLPRSVRVAKLVLRLVESQPRPALMVEGAPCPPADLLRRVREAIQLGSSRRPAGRGSVPPRGGDRRARIRPSAEPRRAPPKPSSA